MVVKGRGKFPVKKVPELPSPTPNITKIASLTKQPASDKALELLHEIATLVTPIMHHYNFTVGLLCEMYPKDKCLLGLNVNRGQKICLRLRSSTDSKWFLERDEIVATMLHELTHNWHGPHDDKFYKTLDELKDKHFEFQIQQSMKTSSYPNNFSNKIRNINKVAVKSTYTTKVTKLGTNRNTNTNQKLNKKLTKEMMRKLLLEAAERRLQDSEKCAEMNSEKLKNVPSDEELHIIDIIKLDSDDDGDDSHHHKSSLNNMEKEKIDTEKIPEIFKKKEEKGNELEIIIID
jgi:hypothetical protein